MIIFSPLDLIPFKDSRVADPLSPPGGLMGASDVTFQKQHSQLPLAPPCSSPSRFWCPASSQRLRLETPQPAVMPPHCALLSGPVPSRTSLNCRCRCGPSSVSRRCLLPNCSHGLGLVHLLGLPSYPRSLFHSIASDPSKEQASSCHSPVQTTLVSKKPKNKT